MKYHIHCKGRRIASFLRAGDRDVCLTALYEAFDDCEFVAVDDLL
jgi:hypothetical protein